MKSLNLAKSSNVEVMKCYNLFFSKNGLIKNLGSYVVLSIFFINIILAILFYIKGYNILHDKIKKIIKNNKNKSQTKDNFITKEMNKNININIRIKKKKKYLSKK